MVDMMRERRGPQLGRTTPIGSSSFKHTDSVTKGQKGWDQGCDLSLSNPGHATSLLEPQLPHLGNRV